MELTRTDAVFSRTAVVLFLCRNKSSQNHLEIYVEYFWNIQKILVGAHPTPLGAPWLVGPTKLHRPQLQLHIFTFGEGKIREKDSSCFTIRSRRHLLFFI